MSLLSTPEVLARVLTPKPPLVHAVKVSKLRTGLLAECNCLMWSIETIGRDESAKTWIDTTAAAHLLEMNA